MCEYQRADVTPRERDLPRDLTRSLACGATRVSRRAGLPLTGGAAPDEGSIPDGTNLARPAPESIGAISGEHFVDGID